jgi:hypothetical protein|tara:strand:- start:76 stop:447 length:372 start_codon:yes stop_codon:yes gene_type:complete
MLTKDIQENFPFVSVVTYGGNEYIGIIINQDVTVTSMYIYTNLKSELEQRAFLELGEAWWWESNRMIPINIFLRGEIEPFKYAIMTMNSKDVKVTIGPCVNLNNLSVKRIKRKSVQLVRKPKN